MLLKWSVRPQVRALHNSVSTAIYSDALLSLIFISGVNQFCILHVVVVAALVFGETVSGQQPEVHPKSQVWLLTQVRGL